MSEVFANGSVSTALWVRDRLAFPSSRRMSENGVLTIEVLRRARTGELSYQGCAERGHR